MLDIHLMGRWDDDEGLHLIRTSELDLPMASFEDDSESNVMLREWWSGSLKLGAPEEIPTSRIDASIQGVLRRDVLDFYLAEPHRTFDEAPSSYGVAGCSPSNWVMVESFLLMAITAGPKHGSATRKPSVCKCSSDRASRRVWRLSHADYPHGHTP